MRNDHVKGACYVPSYLRHLAIGIAMLFVCGPVRAGPQFTIVIPENCPEKIQFFGAIEDIKCEIAKAADGTVLGPTYYYAGGGTVKNVTTGLVELVEQDKAKSASDFAEFLNYTSNDGVARGVALRFTSDLENPNGDSDAADVKTLPTTVVQKMLPEQVFTGEAVVATNKLGGTTTGLKGNAGAIYLPSATEPGGMGGDGIEYIFVSDTDPPVAKSSGKSVIYDAAHATLSFSNDLVDDTGAITDPVIGAEVAPPTFRLAGFSASSVDFVATDPLFTIHSGPTTFLTGDISLLTYSIPDNEFVGAILPISIAGEGPTSPFFDPALPDISSYFLQGVGAFLDPTSAAFEPDQQLEYVVRPDANFFSLTS